MPKIPRKPKTRSTTMSHVVNLNRTRFERLRTQHGLPNLPLMQMDFRTIYTHLRNQGKSEKVAAIIAREMARHRRALLG